MNATTINSGLQTNNSLVGATAEPSFSDDNSIADAIEQELGVDDETTVDEGNQDNDKPVENQDDGTMPKKDASEGDGEDNEEDEPTEVEIPKKFKNKDGSLNIQKLANSYKALEPLINEKSEWEKQKLDLEGKAQIAEQLTKQQDELAKQFGFDSFDALKAKQQEMQTNTQMATFEANVYANYLSLCENPQEVRDLLIQYAQNPSKGLKDQINELFPIEVIEKVAEDRASFKNQLAIQKQQQDRAVNAKRAEEHINNVVTEYKDWFENKEFANVYALAFQYLGIDLDASKMFPAMQALKDSWIKDYENSKATKLENDDAVKVLEGLSPNSTQKPKSTLNVDINTIEPDKLDKLIGDLV